MTVGNGRLGAMLFGGVRNERIQFNKIRLWGGLNDWRTAIAQDLRTAAARVRG
ncbi:MAG: glycoside hydrolase N-terminal domain-containing protein [Pirellulales bacterium]|nr:glycoside hydrolase N-terminal domain-containing protein [Pirellulales bacterium]